MRLNWHGPCASKLLVVAMLLCGTAGPACILPPPIDEESPDANRPPTIDPIFPALENGEAVRLDCNGRPEVFSAIINDENLRDSLYYRFFVDYFRLQPADLFAIEPVRVVPQPNGQARIATQQISILDPTLQERPTDVHIIELLVSDRPFDDGNPDIPATEAARIPVSGGLTASYQWSVYPIECE